jgi:hypothetical protein
MATYNETAEGGSLASGLSENNSDLLVFFDGPNKLVRLSNGAGTIVVKEDIYSPWKEWALIADNLKYFAALRSTGGDPLPGEGEFLGSTFFLINGWKLRLVDDVIIDGNLFTEDGSSPYTTTGDVYVATAKVSTLVERTPAPDSDNARIFV